MSCKGVASWPTGAVQDSFVHCALHCLNNGIIDSCPCAWLRARDSVSYWVLTSSGITQMLRQEMQLPPGQGWHVMQILQHLTICLLSAAAAAPSTFPMNYVQVAQGVRPVLLEQCSVHITDAHQDLWHRLAERDVMALSIADGPVCLHECHPAGCAAAGAPTIPTASLSGTLCLCAGAVCCAWQLGSAGWGWLDLWWQWFSVSCVLLHITISPVH